MDRRGSSRRVWIRRSRAAAALAVVAVLLAASGALWVGGLVTAVAGLDIAVPHTALPTPLEDAAAGPPSLPTVVVDVTGAEIGRFRPEELLRPLDWDEIPRTMRTAVVAAEDASFFDHSGVDVAAVVRAAVRNVEAGEITQGGSTITQQLVKNLYTEGADTLNRKVRELELALAVEAEYSKEEILTAYLNTVYFGEGAVGLGAASRTYFRKPAMELTLSEAALLAGLVPAPSAFNPRANPDAAEARRLEVLARIEAEGMAPAAEIDQARRTPPVVQPSRPTSSRFPFFVDYVRRWLLDVAKFPPELVYSGGLRVETTLDPDVQRAARNSAAIRLPHPYNPEAAIVSVEPASGYVRALVGGRRWDETKVNQALGELGAGTGRQPGSSFKPFVLAAALERGTALNDVVPAPATVTPAGSDDEVGNYTGRGYGTVTVADATRRSINTSYLILAERVGADVVAATARSLGVSVPADVGSSIALGAYEVSPLEMAAAYAAFAADGRRVVPTPVTRVLKNGKQLALPERPQHGKQVVPTTVARYVTAALEDVVDRGTGRRAQFGRPAAGKTGTTNDYTNAWFVGYTPQLSTAVWVGFAEGAIPLRGINGVDRVTGGSLPATMWRDVMYAAHERVDVADFAVPPPLPRRPPPTARAGSRDRRNTATARDGEASRPQGQPTAPSTKPPPQPTTTAPAPRPTTSSPTTEPPPIASTTTQPSPPTSSPPSTSPPPTTAPPPPESTTTTQRPEDRER